MSTFGTYHVSLRLHDEAFSPECVLLSDRLIPKLQVGELIALWPIDPKDSQSSAANPSLPGGISSVSVSKFSSLAAPSSHLPSPSPADAEPP